MTDVSFSVRPGQKIAIAGPAGAGKMTLVNLLMRFYEIEKGVVLNNVLAHSRDFSRELVNTELMFAYS